MKSREAVYFHAGLAASLAQSTLCSHVGVLAWWKGVLSLCYAFPE